MAIFKNTVLNKLFSKTNVIDHIEEVDAVATQVLKTRIAKMGDTESGAYGFYRVRADRGRLTIPLEIKIRNYVLDTFENIDNIHDIGAGIGTLAMAFASYGVESVAIECDARRVAAALAIKTELAKQHKNVAKKFIVIKSTFPSEATKAVKRPNSIATSTNIIGTLPKETQIQIIKGMSKYSAAIVDLQRFGAAREQADEIAELVDCFLANGFETADLALDLGNDGLFYCFTH